MPATNAIAFSIRNGRQQGFTLVELIMVIVILGVVGGMVAVFMRGPIDAYFASVRRAALTDVADTALRRMSRDIRTALPNSLRTSVVGGSPCLEYIPTKSGGRYREQDAVGYAGTALNFSASDSTFNILGLQSDWPVEQQIRANDLIAIYNLGITGVDAYNGDTVVRVSTAADHVNLSNETAVTFAASKLFPLESGGKRFHVIPFEENVVAYVCSGNTLRRVVTPGVSTGTAPLFNNSATSYCGSVTNPAGSAPIIADNVSTCTFTYNGSDLQRNGLVQISLGLTRDGETVTLYHEVHFNNTP